MKTFIVLMTLILMTPLLAKESNLSMNLNALLSKDLVPILENKLTWLEEGYKNERRGDGSLPQLFCKNHTCKISAGKDLVSFGIELFITKEIMVNGYPFKLKMIERTFSLNLLRELTDVIFTPAYAVSDEESIANASLTKRTEDELSKSIVKAINVLYGQYEQVESCLLSSECKLLRERAILTNALELINQFNKQRESCQKELESLRTLASYQAPASDQASRMISQEIPNLIRKIASVQNDEKTKDQTVSAIERHLGKKLTNPGCSDLVSLAFNLKTEKGILAAMTFSPGERKVKDNGLGFAGARGEQYAFIEKLCHSFDLLKSCLIEYNEKELEVYSSLKREKKESEYFPEPPKKIGQETSTR